MKASQDAQRKDFPTGIPECGADALRFGLLAYTVQGRDVNLDILRVVGYRQFCNKMWNAVRFALTYVSDFTPTPSTAADITSMSGVSKRDLFILDRLNSTIEESVTNFNAYLFGNITNALHSFFLYDVCDLYLELVKPVFQDTSAENAAKRTAAQATLYTVLEQYLRLCHPIMPFVTEELWQRLPNRSGLATTNSIMVAPYPKTVDAWKNPGVVADYELFKPVVNSARSMRANYKVANHVKTNFYFKADSEEVTESMSSLADDFCTLARGNFVNPVDANTPRGCSVKVVNDQLSLSLDLRGAIDLDVEIARLEKDIERITPLFDNLKRKTESAGYDKVPESVRLLNTEKMAGYSVELDNVQTAIAEFKSIKD